MATSRLGAGTSTVPSDQTLENFADNLENLPLATLARVFEWAEQTCKFMPSPADLIEQVGDSAPRGRGWTSVARLQREREETLARVRAEEAEHA